MIQIIAGLTFLLILASCGQSSTSNGTPLERIVTTNFSNEPVLLEKQTTTCQETAFAADESNFLLHLFLEGKSTSLDRDLTSLFQGVFLRDRLVISRSVYGEKIELIPTSDGRWQSSILVKPKNLNICPEDRVYAPDTIESAALSAAYFIRKTHDKFRQVAHDIQVAPITLTISPLIMRSTLARDGNGTLIKNSTYMTDNAVYFNGNDTIAFLPMSQSMAESRQQMKFWEVPMVASHEYGHHLFKSIYGLSGSSSTIHDCFHAVDDAPEQMRSIKIEDVLTSLNEGFADLISFYTLDETERGVKGLTCLEVTRDVDSPIMINGKEKIFSKTALSHYFSNFPDFRSGGCHNPSYQEIHVFGAIFAHVADRHLSNLTNSNDEKLQALVAWAKHMKAKIGVNNRLDAKSFFQKSLESFFTVTTIELNKSFDDKACKLVNEVYPELTLAACSP